MIEMTGLLLEGLSNGRCSTPNAFDLRETTPNKKSHIYWKLAVEHLAELTFSDRVTAMLILYIESSL